MSTEELEEKNAQLMRLSHTLEKLRQQLAQKDDLLKRRDVELARSCEMARRLREKDQGTEALRAEVEEANAKMTLMEQQLRAKDFELAQARDEVQVARADRQSALEGERRQRERAASLTEQLHLALERRAELEEAVESVAELHAAVERSEAAALEARRLTVAARREQRRLAERLAAAEAELRRVRDAAAEGGRLLDSRPSSSAPQLPRQLVVAADAAAVVTSALSECSGVTAATSASKRSPDSPRGSLSLTRSSSISSAAGSFSKARTSATAAATTASCPSNNGTRGSLTGGSRCWRASRKLRERVAGLHVHLGDRVILRGCCGGGSGGGIRFERPVEAVVKCIVPGGGGPGAANRYGVRLHDQGGPAATATAVSMAKSQQNTDLRPGCDLMVRARHVEAVFNQKANSFRQLDGLVKDYLSALHQ